MPATSLRSPSSLLRRAAFGLPALLLGLGLSAQGSMGAPALQASDTPTETVAPTNTPSAYNRPFVVLLAYNAGTYSVTPGQEFTLAFRLGNPGGQSAHNVVATFAAGDFVPRGNGGVVAAGVIGAGASTWYSQPLMASPSLLPGSVGTIQLSVSYTDSAGEAYTEAFTLSLPIGSVPRPAGPIPTRTPTPGPRPQLLIRAYHTDVDPLTPGARFRLDLQVQNVGGSTAHRITMILGGGTSSGGTPGAGSDGGLSGASGDFSRFAPVGSSNVQFLGDLAAEQSLIVSQDLIVNGSTEPGAYTIRITFAYSDDRGGGLADDQVITLLVFSPPVVDIGFYRPLDPVYAGEPTLLPVQVVNLGRRSIILGKIEVSAQGAEMSNNSMLIGYLDPGGYFTLDATMTPFTAGPLDVLVTIDYLDDFNQPQALRQVLSVEVLEAPSMPEGWEGLPSGEEQPPAPQSVWQRLWRAVLGFLGLDSAPPTPPPQIMPPYEEEPVPPLPPVPLPGTKG